ncbi:MAG: pyrroline-5-carboxylate reductase [Desulfobacterales bacterium]|nr:pyrroline-5-carboxylate reductase [Desulfobacterales bacterium]MBS3756494.1 pyrroline-5-carboxylate reductase [Desulfobacterales bacterium]
MSPQDRKIGFIGAGNMAEAMIGALINTGQAAARDIYVSDISRQRVSALAETYRATPAANNAQIVADCDIVVLAVKPQVMNEMLEDLDKAGTFESLSGRRLFISVAAGIPISGIEGFIYAGRRDDDKKRMPIVRVMPNTPALIGAGMSGMCANAFAAPSDIETAKNLLSAMGRVIVFEEDKMNAVTAVSGSGPAYGFYVLEAMIEAGRNLGLERSEASVLAQTALSGALALVDHQNETPETLRARVTSPGGTTEAATRVLEEKDVKGAFVDAIAAAAERARQLSRPSDDE